LKTNERNKRLRGAEDKRELAEIDCSKASCNDRKVNEAQERAEAFPGE
jgi:hypothetical protein